MYNGVHTAIITPFIDGSNGPEIDWKSFESLVEEQIASGVTGLVLYGTTGESATLSSEEKITLTKRCKEIVKGRVQLTLGAGSNSTSGTLSFIDAIRDIKPDAILAVAPYYNRPSQEGLYQHYIALAKKGGLPVVMYNVPTRTAVEISVDTIERLSVVDNIIAIKQATDSIANITELCSRVSDRISVLSGDDPSTLFAMLMGAKGTISASACVLPREMVQIVALSEKGEWNKAAEVHTSIFPKIKALFAESNPCPIKAVLAMQGKITSDAVRLPLAQVSPGTREMLKKVFAI